MGFVECKMIINVLNLGVDLYMMDFEDLNVLSWMNQIDGQINLKDVVCCMILFEQNGKLYKLNDKVVMLIVCLCGWYFDEKYVMVDGQCVFGGIFDFVLFLFYNVKELFVCGLGLYFYLLKMESYFEVCLWNDIFVVVQEVVGVLCGMICVMVLIEMIFVVFEMDEILYELCEYSLGLNVGCWDYIFLVIKKFKNDCDFCLVDCLKIMMMVLFMWVYVLLLLKICYKCNVLVIGGMSVLILIKNDLEVNDKVMGGVCLDKQCDVIDGYDGGWVVYLGFVLIVMEEFVKVFGDKLNQIVKQCDDVQVEGKNLFDFQLEVLIIEVGLCNNINVGIYYFGVWFDGNGCVLIYNLMEDVVMVEIFCLQVWQWICLLKGVFDDGCKVMVEFVCEFVKIEFDNVKCVVGGNMQLYECVVVIFEQMLMLEGFIEFLMLLLYEEI